MQVGMGRVRVDQDDVGALFRAHRGQVLGLSRKISTVIAFSHRRSGPEEVHITLACASYGFVKWNLHEDREVPGVRQFRAEQEYAIHEQRGIGWCNVVQLGDRYIEAEVKHGRTV